MAKDLKSISLLDVFPPSIREDLNVQANSVALMPEFRLLAEDVKNVLLYPRLDELSEPILDLLAWERHVDFYELAKTVDAKREVIRGAPAWHRKKGTVWAILKALEMFGIKGTYTNWYEMEPRGRPGTFAIDAELTDEFWQRSDWDKPTSTARRAIVESKAKRSWMSSLYVHVDRELSQELRVGGAIAQGRYQRIGMVQETSGSAALELRAGGAVVQGRHQKIRIAQNTSGNVGLALYAGGAITQGRHQRIGMAQETSGHAGLSVYAGGAIACGIYMKIRMPGGGV